MRDGRNEKKKNEREKEMEKDLRKSARDGFLEILCVSLPVSTGLSWSLGSGPANAIKGYTDISVTEHCKANTC